ncbi:hypothetical protein Rhopal_007366-T1 [Rhodotorula paludigena]|uniref:Fungal lipase-type domain-containing protein n=1 Tax=Rhodotorula paludigena TaxID=86838 RepID=A0AAV5GXQ4_9BASI|nr:hypothetical protein Rhopal_007366-T1 [Rhodotorula paludigena]
MRASLLAAAASAALVRVAFAQDDAAADVSSSQYWHERYHGLLSMAAYSDDPTTTCAQTFTQEALLQSFPDSTALPWTFVRYWGPTEHGGEGFTVVIPEMDKVVMVFKGMYGWESNFNTSTVNVGEALAIGDRCANCTAHAAATAAYLELKTATNDWDLEAAYVQSTGAQWSITGHGYGGMVAQVASLDLGWRGLAHWTHNHGAARVFNAPAAELLNSLYGGEAGQRVVANDDPVPTYIPESENYTMALQGFHVYGDGTNATYGYNFDVCESTTDERCLGTVGGPITDHLSYYTPITKCGNPYYFSNETIENEWLEQAQATFEATATSTFVPPTTTGTPASTAASSAETTATDATATDAAQTAGDGAGTLAAADAGATGTANADNGAAALALTKVGAAVAGLVGAVALLA